MSGLLDHLRSLLEDLTAGLQNVTVRRAFGSFGFFAKDGIFALAFARDGRIGVKLPEADSFNKLMSEPGSAPWAPHKAPMSHWVLVPEGYHDDPDALRPWLQRAHELAVAGVAPTKKPAAKKATAAKATKPAAKKTPEKKPVAKEAPATKKPAAKKAPAKKAPVKKAPAKKPTKRAR